MAVTEILDNHDGELHCHMCGVKPEFLAQFGVIRMACQHCLADAAARLAYEVGRDVCGNCRAFVHCGLSGIVCDKCNLLGHHGWCHRRPPQVLPDGRNVRPAVQSNTTACDQRQPRDRFRAGAAPVLGEEAGR